MSSHQTTSARTPEGDSEHQSPERKTSGATLCHQDGFSTFQVFVRWAPSAMLPTRQGSRVHPQTDGQLLLRQALAVAEALQYRLVE